MVNYKCPRCGYENNIKTKYVKHLRRKKLCSDKLCDIDLYSEYVKYNIIDQIKKYEKTDPKMIQKMEQNGFIDPNKSKNKKYTCKFCKKKYSTNSNLNKHLKNAITNGCKLLDKNFTPVTIPAAPIVPIKVKIKT